MIAALAALILSVQTAPTPPSSTPQDASVPAAVAAQWADADAAGAVIDRLHETAARADGEAYFALFAPRARFIGTDAGEHWDLESFRAYAEPFFARGRGWTYRVEDRVLTVTGDHAWFDEKLRHDSYGSLRGSGVLGRDETGAWKIEQYVLSFTVPNDKAQAVVGLIQAPAAD